MTDKLFVASYGGCGSWQLIDYFKRHIRVVHHVHSRTPPEYICGLRKNDGRDVAEKWDTKKTTSLIANDDNKAKVLYVYREPIFSLLSRKSNNLYHFRNIDVPQSILRKLSRYGFREGYVNEHSLVNYLKSSEDLIGYEEFFRGYYLSERNVNYDIISVHFDVLMTDLGIQRRLCAELGVPHENWPEYKKREYRQDIVALGRIHFASMENLIRHTDKINVNKRKDQINSVSMNKIPIVGNKTTHTNRIMQPDRTRSIMQTWKSADLKSSGAPPIYRIAMDSWKHHNRDWRYVFIDDNRLESYMKCNHGWFTPYWDRYDKMINKVDAFRYFYLYDNGGLYVDMDFECLQPLDRLIDEHCHSNEIVLGKLRNQDGSPHAIPNAFMYAASPQHLFWVYVINQLIVNIDRSTVERRTGPALLKDAYENYKARLTPIRSEIMSGLNLNQDTDKHMNGNEIALLDSKLIYPICWLTMQKERQYYLKNRRRFTNSDMARRFKGSYCVTYWTHNW